MNNVYNDSNKLININNLSLLSLEGSEVEVYNDLEFVYKFFKENYNFKHKTEFELDYLMSINTSRILMPTSKLSKDGNVVGYMMKYIKDSKDILDDKMKNLLNELLIIEADVEVLSNYYVRIMDVNKDNSIYNGSLYLLDFGNYYINDITALLPYLKNKEITDKDKVMIIREWNYNKLNKLIYSLLFINNPNIDFYILRKVIEFFEEERKKYNLLYDYYVYEKYFDKDLTIRESVNKFISSYIKVDEEEKKLILSIFTK